MQQAVVISAQHQQTTWWHSLRPQLQPWLACLQVKSLSRRLQAEGCEPANAEVLGPLHPLTNSVGLGNSSRLVTLHGQAPALMPRSAPVMYHATHSVEPISSPIGRCFDHEVASLQVEPTKHVLVQGVQQLQQTPLAHEHQDLVECTNGRKMAQASECEGQLALLVVAHQDRPSAQQEKRLCSEME
mmetsp:Transcript_34461/g.73410  ORF Transcript_34461/g.73410 Transcript_34461/m.73410 type:complete len:186 (+) Transcript_34461:104-661(+)